MSWAVVETTRRIHRRARVKVAPSLQRASASTAAAFLNLTRVGGCQKDMEGRVVDVGVPSVEALTTGRKTTECEPTKVTRKTR